MSDRKPLTKTLVERIAPPPAGGPDVFAWDGQQRGFGVRVTAAGRRTYVYQYRAKGGQQRRMVLGVHGPMTVQKARERARDAYETVRRGGDPVAEDAAQRAATAAAQKAQDERRTVADVLDDFMQRHVQRGGLRSAHEYESAFDRLVKPAIGAVAVHELRRRQIAEMLDKIEDENGPVMADRTLAYFRKALNWEAARDDTFVSPIVKGMARARPQERARDRVLTDAEIRLVWAALGGAGAWGDFVKALLLTAQRRDECARMARREIAGDGVWTIPAERYKTKRANAVPLSAAALALIEAQPKREGCDFVFPSREGTPRPASGKPKAKLDAALATANGGTPLPAWTLHDLRRTAKTLMARAGVRPDVSERVLGHTIAGVEGTYDRHNYLAEKRDALERLAAEIARVLDPPTANVVALRPAAGG